MTIIYIIVLLMVLLFKNQAKSLLSAVVQLVQALATSLVAAMRQ